MRTCRLTSLQISTRVYLTLLLLLTRSPRILQKKSQTIENHHILICIYQLQRLLQKLPNSSKKVQGINETNKTGINIIDFYFYPEYAENVKRIPKINKIEMHSLKSLVTHEVDEIRGLKYSYILKNYSRLFKYTDSECIALCNGRTGAADLNKSRSIKSRYSHPFNCAIIIIMKCIIHPSHSDISAFNIWDKQLIL